MTNNRFERKEAIALSYDSSESDAPKVVAKGKGKIAENILAKALEHDVPIQEDASLVELLGQLNIEESIPEELYQAYLKCLLMSIKLRESMSWKTLKDYDDF